MNIGEYINERLADVRYYLRGINYNDLNKERAVDGLNDSINTCFNDNPLYRRETEKLVRDIKAMYDVLKDHDLFLVNTKAEVDNAILNFELKLKQRMVEFKDKILLLFQQDTNCQTILVNNSLDDVNIRVRSRKDKKTREELHEMKELFGLRESFIIIYIFMTYIKDKSNKLEEMKDKISETYVPRSQEYFEALNHYITLRDERDYESFIDLHEEITTELFRKTRGTRR